MGHSTNESSEAVSRMGIPLVTWSVTTPPDDYRIASTLDLKEDRRAAGTIRAGFAGAIAVMVGLAVVLDLPLNSPWNGSLVAVVTVASCVVYMVVHELTHGLLLWLLTGVRPSYAVRLPYLATGSQALLTKPVAIVVALAPLVLWGMLLLGLLPTLPAELFLTGYVVLALNLAASSGDVLQAWVISRLPQSALIRDDGRETAVYLRSA